MESIPKKSGIYQIRNLINGKIYIGSSVNMKARKRQHFQKLKQQKHRNPKLQNAYNKYGKANLVFEVVEIVLDKTILIEREQYYIDTLNVVNEGYNICPTAGNTLGVKLSEEARHNIGKAQYKPVVCLETKQVYNSVLEATNKCLKRPKGSAISQCCKGSQITAGGFHWRYKEDYEKLTNAEIHQILLHKPNQKRNILCVESNIIYDSIATASKILNIARSAINHCCNGRKKTAGGFHWKYVDDTKA